MQSILLSAFGAFIQTVLQCFFSITNDFGRKYHRYLINAYVTRKLKAPEFAQNTATPTLSILFFYKYLNLFLVSPL